MQSNESAMRKRDVKRSDLVKAGWYKMESSYKLALCWVGKADVSDDDTFRVEVKTTHVDVMCFGIPKIDDEVAGIYASVDELPEWVRNKLGLLLLMDPTPPTHPVDKVGLRIDKNTFWVYRADEET
jgi:hypothetical protein